MTIEQRLAALVRIVEEEAKDIGIPISRRISKIAVNRRAKARLGCCRQEKSFPGIAHYTIELSERLDGAAEKKIKEVIAHELLHTCPGCMNHGKKWKEYAKKMNSVYGYEISRTYTADSMGITLPGSAEPFRYTLVCMGCGSTVMRKRRSKLVENPELYRCGKCGGKMNLCEKSTTSCR